MKQFKHRYRVTMSYFVYSDEDEAAVIQSMEVAGQMNDETDCFATVDEIWQADHGKIPVSYTHLTLPTKA